MSNIVYNFMTGVRFYDRREILGCAITIKQYLTSTLDAQLYPALFT